VLLRGREGAEAAASALSEKLLSVATRAGVLQWSKAVSQIAEKALDKVDVGALRDALALLPPIVHED